jgi:hypothetical protein
MNNTKLIKEEDGFKNRAIFCRIHICLLPVQKSYDAFYFITGHPFVRFCYRFLFNLNVNIL